MAKKDIRIGDAVEYRIMNHLEGKSWEGWIPATVVSIRFHHNFKSVVGMQGADNIRLALPMDSPDWRVV